jgi:crossover junction endodeoxyribonuclease RuvC
MNVAVIGIDIGTAGALALVDPVGGLVDVRDMPVLRDGSAGRPCICAPLTAELIRIWQPWHAYIEYVGARPGEGAGGAFSFGRSRGVIEGVLAPFGIPITWLTPPTWKRAVGIPPGEAKDAARSAAIQRWPGKAKLFARAKDHGRAEAALIGIAGLLRENRR